MSVVLGEPRGRQTRLDPPPLLTSLVVSSAAGSVDLMARPWRVKRARGLTAPTSRPDVVSLPGRDGVVLRRLTRASNPADAREIELSMFVGRHPSVATPELLSAEVDRLLDVLDPEVYQEGELRLTGYRADGTARYLQVVHTPVAGDQDPLAWWQTTWMPTLRLLAPDPWPRAAARPITWAATSGAPPMLPFFPLRIGSSTVIGNANPVAVLGDRDAWPTVTVTGPATSITCARGDGATWTLVPPSPLLAGQTVTVRHDPDTGVVDDFDVVTGPAGQSWFRYLTAGSLLWGLRPGTEAVQITVPGSDATTRATITWDHRYRSLL